MRSVQGGAVNVRARPVVNAATMASMKARRSAGAAVGAAGAASGGFWGVLVGLLFLNPLLGAAVGAGVGAASGALSDLGINDDFLREVGEGLTSGTAALCVLLRNSAPDRVIERLQAHAPNARLLRTNLSHADEARLRQLLEQASQQVRGESA